ncbi:hypothetical protein FHS83_002355 [Rhizomicrobium palustre]|jgi:hypothetical protein|uniref:Uncharacterized protein n=1 Tax=Rhizomicrobium palustre TaxID=189966 RepID=A0A846N1K9_9PROT|nr:hypothetical protein [Rhizomicrobium palustre]NIK89037.1 hypothetical protein [Rhizomicrobium palustre]
MDESYSSTVKSIGAIILTLVLFLGVGYYVYTSLFVPPGPAQVEDQVATAPAQSAPAAKTPS